MTAQPARSRLAALMVLLLVMGGCASQDSGLVDESSYRHAFDEFASCMETSGYPVVVHDDAGVIIDYSIPGAVIGTPAEEECYAPFRNIDMQWQVRNEDTSKGALAVRECLRDHGIEPVGTAAGDWELILENQLESICP